MRQGWQRLATRLLVALAVASIGTGMETPTTSSATTQAKLEVELVPERLGRGTTIDFGFRLAGPGGTIPPPVTQIALYFPADLGIITSDLGTASCTTATLELAGPEGCPSQALMGYGTATGEVQVGSEPIEESAITAVFMAPFDDGNIDLQFFLDAQTPLSGEWVFRGLLLPAPAPFGGVLTITVPLIESFARGPDVALVRLESTIGPLGITYYNRIHGKFVPYQPSGILLPHHCPRGGFPFGAKFTFAEGSTTTAHRKVRCPRESSVASER
jgi:hypothetical protein